MFDYPWIVLAARRMGLRDKGRIQSSFSHIDACGDEWRWTTRCRVCKTRVRIGIERQTGSTWVYCWRCETKGDCVPTSLPTGKEPVPEQTEATGTPFPRKKNAEEA